MGCGTELASASATSSQKLDVVVVVVVANKRSTAAPCINYSVHGPADDTSRQPTGQPPVLTAAINLGRVGGAVPVSSWAVGGGRHIALVRGHTNERDPRRRRPGCACSDDDDVVRRPPARHHRSTVLHSLGGSSSARTGSNRSGPNPATLRYTPFTR